MSCHGEMQTTVYPGDIIIIDTNKWFHSTKVEDGWISQTFIMESFLKLIKQTFFQILGPELAISIVYEFE